jgi:hypothetical protein
MEGNRTSGIDILKTHVNKPKDQLKHKPLRDAMKSSTQGQYIAPPAKGTS